jgi:hypothetical protein
MSSFRGRPGLRFFGPGRAALLTLSIACFVCCSCSRRNVQLSAEEARQTLEAALTAWQNGAAAGKKVETASAPIGVMDGDWLSGKKLESYEILGGETDEAGRHRLSARLHFRSPSETKEVKYVITGGAERGVFQEDDYKRTRRWQGFPQDKKDRSR